MNSHELHELLNKKQHFFQKAIDALNKNDKQTAYKLFNIEQGFSQSISKLLHSSEYNTYTKPDIDAINDIETLYEDTKEQEQEW